MKYKKFKYQFNVYLMSQQQIQVRLSYREIVCVCVSYFNSSGILGNKAGERYVIKNMSSFKHRKHGEKWGSVSVGE